MAQGEEVFRDHETAALERALRRPPSVIALGGGALLRKANRRRAEEHGQVVCLDADNATLLARLERDETPRPLLQEHPPAQLADLLARRREHYDSFPMRIPLSGLTGEAGDRPPLAVARDIVRRLNRLRVRVPEGRAYDVALRPNGLDGLGDLVRERGLGGPLAVIADDTVARLYGERALGSLRRAGFEPQLATFPAGERSKTIESLTSSHSTVRGEGTVAQ